MNAPLINFSLLWRGQRCPRQLRAWLNHSKLFNPKLCGLDELTAESLSISRLFYPDNPAAAQTEVLDAHFQAWQEQRVLRLSQSLFPQAQAPDGESLWELEGETLREIGWLSASKSNGAKHQDITKLNWLAQLSGMPGIFRSTMVHHFIVASADYLFLDHENNWVMLLVKPGFRMKDSYIAEAELTRWVYAQKGIAIKRCYLLTPSEDFELPRNSAEPKAIDYFQFHSLNQAIKHLPDPISGRLPEILTAAAQDVGCENTKTCPVCQADQEKLPEHNIYTLHRGGKAVELLEAENIIDLADLDKASPAAKAELKDRHFIQIKAIKARQSHADKPALAKFLAGIRYPVCFLDFESTSEAIPPVASSRPWEHLPFMFSSHIAKKPADLHKPSAMQSKIAMVNPLQKRQDQIRGFALDLMAACQGCASLVVYGSALEIATFSRLARALPDLAGALYSLRDKIIDLQQPFAEFWFYHPQQYGKLSLKKILPLLSSQNHNQLELQSGGEANLIFYFLENPEALPEYLKPNFNIDSLPQWQETLSRYCGLDTLGLAHILDALNRLAE